MGGSLFLPLSRRWKVKCIRSEGLIGVAVGSCVCVLG